MKMYYFNVNFENFRNFHENGFYESVCLSVWKAMNTLVRFSILNMWLTTVFYVFYVITAIYVIFFNYTR